MKRFEALKSYPVFVLMLGILALLPGCGKGTFGGGDWDVPVSVSSTAPVRNAVAVPVGNKLTATFSGAMNPASITPASFTVRRGATAVVGTVAYTGVTAVFTPATNLPANTLYVATITTGAQDAKGRALASDYSWSFTTG